MKSLFILLFVLLFISCEDSTGPDNDMLASDYFSLEDGSTWVRQTTNTRNGSTGSSIDTMILDGEVLLHGGISGYRFKSVSSSGQGDCVTYVDGELRMYNYPPDTIEYSAWVAEPIEVGNEWIMGRDQYGYDDKHWYIAEIGVTATVPAGTYENCIKICEKERPAGETYYRLFAPDVGLIKVKWENEIENGGMEIMEFYKD